MGKNGPSRGSKPLEASESTAHLDDNDLISDLSDSGSEITRTDDEDSYEKLRQLNISLNASMMAELGLIDTSSHQKGTSQSSKKPSGPRKVTRTRHQKEIRDRSGYIVSLPRQGERHIVACVEIPGGRRLRRKIVNGDYIDVSPWLEGEARRWRFGHGLSKLEAGEEPLVGGVGEDFRWREWTGPNAKGRRQELHAANVERGQYEHRHDEARQPGHSVPSSYSLISGDTCHQCRRKSEKTKMQCRNVDPNCRASFCESCCKRYDYFTFDTESRSFICPLCRDCCNCASCLRKRNLGHLLQVRSSNGKMGISPNVIAPGETVQSFVDRVHIRQPDFDRVRLVSMDDDVVTPHLPQEWIDFITPTPPRGKGRSEKRKVAPTGVARKGREACASVCPVEEPNPKKARNPSTITSEGDNTVNIVSHPIILRIPPRSRKPKEVDSDGDTVGGYSIDEGGLQNWQETGSSGPYRSHTQPHNSPRRSLTSLSDSIHNSQLRSELIPSHHFQIQTAPRELRLVNNSLSRFSSSKRDRSCSPSSDDSASLLPPTTLNPLPPKTNDYLARLAGMTENSTLGLNRSEYGAVCLPDAELVLNTDGLPDTFSSDTTGSTHSIYSIFHSGDIRSASSVDDRLRGTTTSSPGDRNSDATSPPLSLLTSSAPITDQMLPMLPTLLEHETASDLLPFSFISEETTCISVKPQPTIRPRCRPSLATLISHEIEHSTPLEGQVETLAKHTAAGHDVSRPFRTIDDDQPCATLAPEFSATPSTPTVRSAIPFAESSSPTPKPSTPEGYPMTPMTSTGYSRPFQLSRSGFQADSDATFSRQSNIPPQNCLNYFDFITFATERAQSLLLSDSHVISDPDGSSAYKSATNEWVAGLSPIRSWDD